MTVSLLAPRPSGVAAALVRIVLHRHDRTLSRRAAAAGQMRTATAQAPSAAGGGVARPKGWDQCINFARLVKAKQVTGVELVKVWKSTCEPAVRSGRATDRYRVMCNSLSGAVEPFASQVDYNVDQLCDTVLTVFHDMTAADVSAR